MRWLSTQHAAVAAHGGDERRRPAVLVDDHDGRAAGLDRLCGGRGVLVAEQAGGGALEDREVADALSQSRSCASKPENVPSSFFITNRRRARG